MKRIACIAAALMLVPALAPAQDYSSTANGVVESATTWELTAPYSGVVLPYEGEHGDGVRAGEALFTMDTYKVYASESGTVRALFTAQGELCEDAMARYGMVAAIERDIPLRIAATTRGAYKSSENMLLHMGASVYFEQSGSGDSEGEGRIVLVNGSSFVIDVESGEFDPGDVVKIYRDEEKGSRSNIGQGTVERAPDAAVSAAGRVLFCHAYEGQHVEKGQLLLTLAASDADGGITDARVRTDRDGTLSAIKVACGQQVYKGQSLATIADLSALQVRAEVDEIDLNNVRVGDALQIVFDRYPDAEVEGVVTDISRIGMPKQNAAYYDVTLSYECDMETLPGMNATVWIPSREN